MSRYPGNEYPRRSSPPPRWAQDRRSSYNESARGRGRELRDAPPLGGIRPAYRDGRDFSPRETRDDPSRQRRMSRDGPMIISTQFDVPPPYRGGFRGRGRGDGEFRGGRMGRGRYVDDRDIFPRDRSRERSPPRYFRDGSRDERSPDRRDERAFPRREDTRWSDRDREIERQRRQDAPAPIRPYNEAAPNIAASPASMVNPERLALIADTSDLVIKRPAAGSTKLPAARESELPAYLTGRAETTSNRYGSRASSPPTQPPPVPAFTLSFAPAPSHNIIKPSTETKHVEASAPTGDTQRPRSQDKPIVQQPPEIPRAPKAQTISTKAEESAPMKHEVIAPTGPKAERTAPHPLTSPRIPFSMLNKGPMQATTRPRSPPVPSAPRSHVMNRSPEVSFTTAPTAPKAERATSMQAPDRLMSRPSMQATRSPAIPAPRLPQAAARSQWNQWRRDEQPQLTDRQHVGSEIRKPDTQASTASEDKMDIDPAPMKPASPTGHSAQQSFFGKPTTEIEEPEMSDVVDDSLSTTDEDEMEVENIALFEAKFERQRRELEARLIDLSQQRYRATTPLETLARISRVTMKDVERFRNQPDMDLDETNVVEAPVAHSSESEEGVDLLTPKEEGAGSVMIHDSDETEEIIKRIRPPTPEMIDLPFMIKDPPTTHDIFEETRRRATLEHEYQDEIEAEIIQEMQLDQHDNKTLTDQFAQLYRIWREQCEDFEHEQREIEKLERQASLEPGPEPEPMSATAGNPVAEGRRLHKFSSEYDIQQILKESEETARIEQEKAEREAKKVQADMEKEATIPDQMTLNELQRSTFIDHNRLRAPETLTIVFTYEPAPDDFTEQEQHIFVAAFKETPKKWSEIASLLPGRQPKDCIRHYYANKWDGRFRDTRTRKMKSKRGRGNKAVRSKGSAMADLARNEDLPVAMSDSGRPKRAAAPTTFGEKETEAKALLAAQSPAKRAGPSFGKDGQADDKPAKRRRPAGDKPGRRPKGGQTLASLAAAPMISPDGSTVPTQTKESIDRRLEEASLLTGFHAGRPMIAEQPIAYNVAEQYMHRQMDDRLRAPLNLTQSNKQSPSSYWSVPEQTDFNKCVKHFGTDFAAIANHMGTKTQTMIKNHYQRQIDGGNRPDLQADAEAANARRERGEDLGRPPTPTPITKRKYDQPPPTQRSLVHDPMEVDERKHVSPPHFAMQPQYPPQPGRASESSVTPILAASVPSRPFQPRPGIFSEPRNETRPNINAMPSYMIPLSTAPPLKKSRSLREAQDPHFIQSLLDEQARARRMERHYDRGDYYPSGSQHSPQAQSAMPERPQLDMRAGSPPMPLYANKNAPPQASRSFEAPRYPQHSSIPSPTKQEPRTSIGSTPFPQTQAAEPPKRSNVMSLLNEPEEPKPKRNSMEGITSIPRHGSPAQHILPPSGYSGIQRSEPYNQPPAGHFQYRPAIQPPAVSSSLKQEPLSASSAVVPTGMPPKTEWPARGHGTHTPPTAAAPSFERGTNRPYYPHMLGQLGTPNRANPSPPPHTGLQHSRGASMATGDPAHRSYVPAASTAPSSSLYRAPYTQGPSSTLHAPSHETGFAHQRVHSHEEQASQWRPEQWKRDAPEMKDGDYYYRQIQEERRQAQAAEQRQHAETARQRERDEQRRYEQERQYARPPIPAQPTQGYTSYEQGSRYADNSLSLRERSEREAQMHVQQEEERFRGTNYFREREVTDTERRRHDDAFLLGARRTPLGSGSGPGNGYGVPGPPANRR